MEVQADQDPGDLLCCLWARRPAYPLVGCPYCRSVFTSELSHRVEGTHKASCWLQTALYTGCGGARRVLPQVTEVAVLGAPAWARVRGETCGLSCLVSAEVTSSSHLVKGGHRGPVGHGCSVLMVCHLTRMICFVILKSLLHFGPEAYPPLHACAVHMASRGRGSRVDGTLITTG